MGLSAVTWVQSDDCTVRNRFNVLNRFNLNFVIPTDKCDSSTTLAASLPVVVQSRSQRLCCSPAWTGCSRSLPLLQCRGLRAAAPGCPSRMGPCHSCLFMLCGPGRGRWSCSGAASSRKQGSLLSERQWPPIESLCRPRQESLRKLLWSLVSGCWQCREL